MVQKISAPNVLAKTSDVWRDRETFGYCVEYLDQLHPNRQLIRELEKEEEMREKEAQEKAERKKKLERELEEANEAISEETIDRYSY